MPQVYIKRNFQLWPKTKLSSVQSTVPLPLPQTMKHWNKVALKTASWVPWFSVAFSLLFWQNTTRTHSPHFFLPKQSHIRHNSYFLTVRPTFSSLWYGIVWNEIYQLWIYWTELIYKSSPQHLMGGWVRLTCKTICFYWSSSCGLTLTQWKPAITWAFLSMFPIQKVEMRFKNLLARKPILGSSFLNTRGEICSYVTAGRSVKFWTNLMSAQHH